ncbi:T-complex protein 1 subunit eta [Neonectria magnoliae]|uniref:T-complex protein 1 subunit eta n=1 Tax=Neonectria magnoliae TaxID=2732573 RepID=A0ABR1H1L4_9HYPO
MEQKFAVTASSYRYHMPMPTFGKGNIWAGVDFQKEGIADMMESFVWEPAMVKITIQAATEASRLRVDETIRNEESALQANTIWGFLFFNRHGSTLLAWLTLNAAVSPFLAVFAGDPGFWLS